MGMEVKVVAVRMNREKKLQHNGKSIDFDETEAAVACAIVIQTHLAAVYINNQP